MNQEWAKQQLAAQLKERTRFIQGDLMPGETVLDSGEINELSMNALGNLGAGEALLFVTDRRLILYRGGSSESFDYDEIASFKLGRVPRGVPQRGMFRELTLNLKGGATRSLIGGRLFLSAVKSALRR